MFNFKEDWEDPTKKAIQKIISYKGYIPSKDLNEYQYQTYLQVASPYELEKDIIYEETMCKVIGEECKNSLDTCNYSHARLMRIYE
jgi:hypothetical protein